MAEAAQPEKRYELVERIAVGGMAEVFRAKAYGPHGFEKVLAIKRILPGLAADPKFERRFVTEAKVAVSLGHANIVQVFDFSRFGQSLYIVMEFVDGGDLAHVLQLMRERGEHVPLEAAMHIAVEICKGLDFAHKRDVVHRDMSPSNILLSRSGEVKIADFGIAQMGGIDASRTLKIMGKWRYMSPEQSLGEEVDARSDVFSTGSVLFELFTGHRLFPGADAEEIVQNIHSMELPRASELRSDLPPELDATLRAVLERDRARRITSAADLLHQILEVCYARSIPALPTSLAKFLEEIEPGGFKPKRDDDDEDSGPPRLLDEILVSELGGKRGKRRPAPDPAGGPRRTAMALAPPPILPEDAPGEADDFTGVTYIRSVPEPDGQRRWVGGEGTPAAPEEAATMAVLAPEPTLEPELSVTRATTQPPPARPFTSHSGVHLHTDNVALPAWQTRKVRGLIAAAIGLVAGVVIVAVISSGGGGDAAKARPAQPVAVVVPTADAQPPVPVPVPSGAAAVDAAPVAAPGPDAGAVGGADAGPAPDHPDHARQRFGTVDIYSDPWANIYLGKRKVGVAPQRALRLPVGRHRLRLVNPVLKRSMTVTVTIPATKPVRVTLPRSASDP